MQCAVNEDAPQPRFVAVAVPHGAVAMPTFMVVGPGDSLAASRRTCFNASLEAGVPATAERVPSNLIRLTPA